MMFEWHGMNEDVCSIPVKYFLMPAASMGSTAVRSPDELQSSLTICTNEHSIDIYLLLCYTCSFVEIIYPN